MNMKQTEMKIRERKGFSIHNAVLEVRGENEHAKNAHAEKLIIHGPTGCDIELKADDVIAALYDFVKSVSKCVDCTGGYCEEECLKEVAKE